MKKIMKWRKLYGKKISVNVKMLAEMLQRGRKYLIGNSLYG